MPTTPAATSPGSTRPPPTAVQEDETLVANLVAACDLLAMACTQYAAHIEQALGQIDGGSVFDIGDDGGLRNLVLGDPWIHALGDVAHVLDSARARVKLPRTAPRPVTLYLLVPPAGDPHAGGLDLRAFEGAMREGFASAGGQLRDPGSPDERFAFLATTDDELTFEGNASVYARDCVAVRDVTPAEAARFVVWLRAAVLPGSAAIRFTSRAAIEEGFDEREWRIPDGADRAGAEASLRQHLADVEEGAAWESGGS